MSGSTEQSSSERAHASLEELLKRNIELSESICAQNKKIKRYIIAGTIGNYLRLLLVIVPLIIAAIYLPPLLAPYLSQMRDLLGTASGSSKELQDFLKSLK